MKPRSTTTANRWVISRARDAKLAVLEWDAGRGALRPSSLHYFEGDPALRAQRTVFARPPVVRTDPQVTDSVMLTGHDLCASIPHQSLQRDGMWLRSTCHDICCTRWHGPSILSIFEQWTDLINSSSGSLPSRIFPRLHMQRCVWL